MYLNLMIVLIGIIAAYITYYISIELKKGAVFASAIVTLTAGLLLPRIFVDGAILAAVAACSSYAGMVSKDKFKSSKDMIFVGLICSLIFIVTLDAYVGVGGRLGTIAAIAGFSFLGMKGYLNRYFKSKKI